jgi:hypothetical protein
MLVTAEMYLYRIHVEECLEGAKFKSKFLNHVFFGLAYHPADPETGNGGRNSGVSLTSRTSGKS